MANREKMKIKVKKFGKINLIFELSISKLGYMAIFMKIYWKKVLTHFLGHFWLIETKMKLKVKIYGKMFSMFKLSISKLVNMVIFMKIGEKRFWLSF